MKKFLFRLFIFSMTAMTLSCNTVMEAACEGPLHRSGYHLHQRLVESRSQSHPQREGGARPGGGIWSVYRLQ